MVKRPLSNRLLAAGLLLASAAVPCAADPVPAVFPSDSVRVGTDVDLEAFAGKVSTAQSGHDMGGIPPADADLYRLYISSQDGPHCTFQLTCSGYAKQAIRKKGLIVGSLLAADRLLRCHGLGSAAYPVDPATGKLLDPVP